MISFNPKKLSNRIRLQKLNQRQHSEQNFNQQMMEKFGRCIEKFNQTLMSFGEMFYKAQTQRTEKSFVSEVTEMQKQSTQLEQRFQQVEVSFPRISKEKEELEIKKWLGELCKSVFSVGFKLYLNETFNYSQAKIFCCQNMLYNLIKFIKKNQLEKHHLEFINKSLSKDLIPYFLLKYPQSEALDVNLRLSNLVTEIDNSYSNENDFIYASGVKFSYQPSGQYNSKIMQILNYLIQLPQQTIKFEDRLQNQQAKEEEGSLYNAFTSDFENLFRKLEDQNEVIRMKSFHKKRITDKKNLTQYQIKKKQNYQEKVKEYTKYLIGRKLSENVSQYSEEQIKGGNFKAKNTQVLRILTKWCHELEKYFEKINELVVEREEQFRMRDGSQQYMKKTYRILLKKLLEKQKKKIDDFLKKVMENNYTHQGNYMKKKTPEEFECFSEQESTVGLFTAVMFKNNENYIKGYLNSLIHCLMTAQTDFEEIIRAQAKKGKKISNRIENVCSGKNDILELLEYVKKIQIRKTSSFDDKVPELITFKISDLIRCKCSSREFQITALFNQIKRISQKNPQIFKIVRIKNRLDKGTRDVLLNLRYRQKALMEIQLAVNPQKSKFIQYSDHFNHFLYELERAQFGPISELCSVWINSDNRAQFYRKKFKRLNIRQQIKQNQILHDCNGELVQQKLPFECSYCKFYWTDQNTIEEHSKCLKCKKWICSMCSLQNFSNDLILEKVGIQLKSQNIEFGSLSFIDKIPDYGACTFLYSKDLKLKIFRKITYGSRQYLFEEVKTRQDTEFTLLADVTSKGQKKKFISRNMIVQLDTKRNISLSEIAQKYFVPRYILECYKKEKMSLLLEKQGIRKGFFQNVEKYRNVTKVNFSENQIKESQWIIEKFPKLEIAVLSENKLENLHQTINGLKNLLFVSLNSNQLKELPDQISNLHYLQHLNLNNNQLTILPETFKDLKRLKNLYMASNKLQELPILPSSLNLLDVNHNKIQNIKLDNLRDLKNLILAYNKIENIDSLAQLEKLQTLDISYNSVGGEFVMNNLLNLEGVNLSYNNITDLDIKYENPANSKLKNLDVSFNKINNIKDCLYENIVNIEVLNLQNNKVGKLSSNIKLLTNLKELNITGIYEKPDNQSLLALSQQDEIEEKKIHILPPDIDVSLTNLQILSMGRNQLTRIPPFVSFMKHLRELYLSRNKITKITEHIGVQILDLNYNRLQIFDGDTADKLPNVKEIGLRGNKIKQIYQEDIKRMIGLQDIDTEENPDLEWIQMIKKMGNDSLKPAELIDRSRKSSTHSNKDLDFSKGNRTKIKKKTEQII